MDYFFSDPQIPEGSTSFDTSPAGERRPLPPRAPGLSVLVAGAVHGGLAEPAGGGERRRADVPIRDARPRAG
eukprot:5137978-Alexandrium_andersonii.AAC.1